jgi:hypothetical protein
VCSAELTYYYSKVKLGCLALLTVRTYQYCATILRFYLPLEPDCDLGFMMSLTSKSVAIESRTLSTMLPPQSTRGVPHRMPSSRTAIMILPPPSPLPPSPSYGGDVISNNEDDFDDVSTHPRSIPRATTVGFSNGATTTTATTTATTTTTTATAMTSTTMKTAARRSVWQPPKCGFIP